MSTVFFIEVVEGLSPRNLIERSLREDDDVSRCDLSLSPQVPSSMDEVRRTEYAAGPSVLVAAKTNEVNCHVLLQKERASETFIFEALNLRVSKDHVKMQRLRCHPTACAGWSRGMLHNCKFV